MRYSKTFLSGLYLTMQRIRQSEEALVDAIARRVVECPCHLCSGEEAIAAGVCAALKPKDQLFGTHRSHGHFLAKGGSLRSMMAEIHCRETGCARGRGGSMHLIDPECGMMGAAPIVGGTISLALGAALAASIRGDGRVVASFFGDGAMGEGVLYEVMNFAALKKLPLILVCENNLYSTHLPIEECRADARIFRTAPTFGVVSRRLDGNDVLAVYDAAQEAVAACRQGKGPAFFECLTYRFRGHVGPDDNIQGSHTDIRPPREVAEWVRRDPLILLGRRMLDGGGFTQKELDSLVGKAGREVRDAMAFALASAHPKKKDLTRYVYR